VPVLPWHAERVPPRWRNCISCCFIGVDSWVPFSLSWYLINKTKLKLWTTATTWMFCVPWPLSLVHEVVVMFCCPGSSTFCYPILLVQTCMAPMIINIWIKQWSWDYDCFVCSSQQGCFIRFCDVYLVHPPFQNIGCLDFYSFIEFRNTCTHCVGTPGLGYPPLAVSKQEP